MSADDEGWLVDAGVVGVDCGMVQPANAISRPVSASTLERDKAVFMTRTFRSVPASAGYKVDGHIVVTVAEAAIRHQNEWPSFPQGNRQRERLARPQLD
ncbi:hypothetical protein [Arthrobacter sp. HLT1-20]